MRGKLNRAVRQVTTVSDRLMQICIDGGATKIVITNVHLPHQGRDAEMRQKAIVALETVMGKTDVGAMHVLGGDMNADPRNYGREYAHVLENTYPCRAADKAGVEGEGSTAKMFLELCSSKGMKVKTGQGKPARRRATYINPSGTSHRTIDHLAIHGRWGVMHARGESQTRPTAEHV